MSKPTDTNVSLDGQQQPDVTNIGQPDVDPGMEPDEEPVEEDDEEE